MSKSNMAEREMSVDDSVLSGMQDDMESIFGRDQDASLLEEYVDAEARLAWNPVQPTLLAFPFGQLTLPSAFSATLDSPSLPDPPKAPLWARDGHTSGDDVVSARDQSPAAPASSTRCHGPAQNADDELEARAYRGILGHDPVDKQLDSSVLPDGYGISVHQACPDYRASGVFNRDAVCLPRRVDVDESHLELILPFFSYARQNRHRHFLELELSEAQGKALDNDIMRFFHNATDPLVTALATRGGLSTGPGARLEDRNAKDKEAKRCFLKSSLLLLKTQGWGIKWFVNSNRPDMPRQKTWPRDSTEIVVRLARFMHRCARLGKQTRKKRGTLDSETRRAKKVARRSLSRGQTRMADADRQWLDKAKNHALARQQDTPHFVAQSLVSSGPVNLRGDTNPPQSSALSQGHSPHSDWSSPDSIPSTPESGSDEVDAATADILRMHGTTAEVEDNPMPQAQSAENMTAATFETTILQPLTSPLDAIVEPLIVMTENAQNFMADFYLPHLSDLAYFSASVESLASFASSSVGVATHGIPGSDQHAAHVEAPATPQSLMRSALSFSAPECTAATGFHQLVPISTPIAELVETAVLSKLSFQATTHGAADSVPADAPLTYHVSWREACSGTELISTTKLRHAEYGLALFSSIQDALQALQSFVRQSGSVILLTLDGLRPVHSQSEWTRAVWEMYNWRPGGADVLIDVLV